MCTWKLWFTSYGYRAQYHDLPAYYSKRIVVKFGAGLQHTYHALSSYSTLGILRTSSCIILPTSINLATKIALIIRAFTLRSWQEISGFSIPQNTQVWSTFLPLNLVFSRHQYCNGKAIAFCQQPFHEQFAIPWQQAAYNITLVCYEISIQYITYSIITLK